MVNKQCGVCGRYFSGELDGNYTCEGCLRAGAVRRRPLMALDSHMAHWAGPPAIEPATQSPRPFHMRGQAA